jgi:FkbM family methyltransferase
MSKDIGPSALAHSLFDTAVRRIGARLRNRRWDFRRLDRSELTHRVLDHDLPRLVASPAPLIFDVGANKGQTIELMSRLFPSCELYAFEPSAVLAQTLCDRYVSRRVTVEAIALGAREEERQFFTYQNNELSSFLSLAKSPSNPFADVGVAAVDAVRVETIDDYCEACGIRAIEILKIDTQGFDLEVLKGATRMLSAGAIGVVLVEINFIPLYDAQCTPGEMIDWLIGHGFQLLALYEQVRLRQALSWATACFVRP